MAERLALSRNTRLNLPGDPQLAEGIDWSKQNVADMVQDVRDLQLRPVDQGHAYPAPVERLARARFIGAGWPDYPWLFATDGEYTAFASVAIGQFEAIKDHLRALRHVSRKINGDSGKVVHEVITDGSVYFGTLADPGNTDETAKFPSAVALIWRWTGDQRFLDEMYDFARANMRYVLGSLDADHDLWPEGLGNVERPGMGEEKLDSTVYTIRGLRDLAALARAKRDRATELWAEARASAMEARFDSAWWMPNVPQHADSLGNPDNRKVQQRHWIGVTPMEVELERSGDPVLGLTTRTRGNDALQLRQTNCYAGALGSSIPARPAATPCSRQFPPSEGHSRSTPPLWPWRKAITAVSVKVVSNASPPAIAACSYPSRTSSRVLCPKLLRHPIIAVRLTFRCTNGPWSFRLGEPTALYGQWSTSGSASFPTSATTASRVTPQVPPGSPSIAGDNIRLGDGSLAVTAQASRGTYMTAVRLDVPANLVIGHTIPLVGAVTQVTLNGQEVPYKVRLTNRGREILVPAGPVIHSQLIVRTAS